MFEDFIGTILCIIFGFGVWRGQNLWKTHIELKHGREMERLNMDKHVKIIEVEIARDKALGEIERQKELASHPQLTLPSGEVMFNPGQHPFVCGCNANPTWHLHVAKKGIGQILPLSLGAMQVIKDEDFPNLCICQDDPKEIHAHHQSSHKRKVVLSLTEAGYTMLRKIHMPPGITFSGGDWRDELIDDWANPTMNSDRIIDRGPIS